MAAGAVFPEPTPTVSQASFRTVRATASGDGPPFLLIVDGVTDPGNLGAVLRSASAAGVTGVVLARHRAVHVTPTVAKAAAGAIEHLPIAVVGGIPTAMSRLRDMGVWLLGLDADGDRSVWDLDLGDVPMPAPAAAVAGYPSLTVPAGFICGLPVGVSFFGAAFSEPVLLRLGYAFEQATRVRQPPRFLEHAEV